MVGNKNNVPSGDSVHLSRRGFLGAAGKTSTLAVIALYSASGLAVLTTHSAASVGAQHRVLREQDIKFFKAVLPVVIPQAVSPNDEVAFLNSLDLFLAHADVETTQLIQQLVDLVTGPVTRFAMTGTLWDWPDFDPPSVEAILVSWRDSYFELPKTAYAVSTRLIATAWYMIPENQGVTGYKGPPKKIVD